MIDQRCPVCTCRSLGSFHVIGVLALQAPGRVGPLGGGHGPWEVHPYFFHFRGTWTLLRSLRVQHGEMGGNGSTGNVILVNTSLHPETPTRPNAPFRKRSSILR